MSHDSPVTHRNPTTTLPSYPGVPADAAVAVDGRPVAEPRPARPRWPWIVLVVLGLVLAIAPLAGGMLYPAAQGQAMIGAFEPYLDSQRLDGFRADLGRLDAARAATLRLDAASGVDADRFAQITAFQQRYPGIDRDMTDLIDRIDGARTDFGRLAALRPLDMVPFIPLGAGLVLVGAGIWGWRRRGSGVARVAAGTLALVVAIGLVATPVATSMVGNTRAAGPLLDRFGSVVTAQKVREVQGYFVVLVGAVGQIDSGYRQTVATPSAAPADLAAVDGLSAAWQRMSSDFAGLIGTMNDNVANLAGVARLNNRTAPLGFGAFAALPWFLIAVGALAGLTATAGLGLRARGTRPSRRRGTR